MIVFGNLVSAAVLVLLCLFGLRSRFGYRWSSSRQHIAALIGSWVLLGAAFAVWGDPLIRAVLAVLIAGFLGWYIGQLSIAKAALFGVIFGALHLVSSCAALVISRGFPGTSDPCSMLTGITIFYGLVVLITAFQGRLRSAALPLLRLLPVWLVSVILCEEIIRNRRYESIAVLTVFAFIWMLYAGILLIPVGNKLEARLLDHLEAQQKAHHYALQEEYYQQLRSKQTETRALWHDLNKYLQAAKAEQSSAQALEQLESMLNSATEIIDVGNQVLNVILNEYAQMAKAAGIDLQLRVQIPEKLGVSVADLYILIGNTMDNAIEACHALPPDQRTITLTLRTHNQVLYYRLANPYNTAQPERKDDPLHGHGLHNVRRCVEKYHGIVDTAKEDGFFSITAHMNLEKL